MRLAAHEAYDLNELALSCVKTITCMAGFLNQVQDPELKSMLQKHLPLHIQDYNMKVDFLRKEAGTTVKLPVPELPQVLQSFTEAPTKPVPVTPRTTLQQFDDREIATAYLLSLKRAGREYAWAAMEMSNPRLRSFLEDAFLMNSRHAYEVWQWMVKKGYYPLEPASKATIDTLSSMYRPVEQPVTV